jgi:hypothetical protein
VERPPVSLHLADGVCGGGCRLIPLVQRSHRHFLALYCVFLELAGLGTLVLLVHPSILGSIY